MTDAVVFPSGYITESKQKTEAAYPLLLRYFERLDRTLPDKTRKVFVLRPRELEELRSQTELIFEGSSASSVSWFAFDIKDGLVSTLKATNVLLFRNPLLKGWPARARAWAERYERSKIVLTEAEEQLYYRDELVNVMDID